ncbi:hypothetical protein EGH21_11615 [Halomicroarcula sp. F13]|uniref:Methylamine utilization protein MauE n=1 Tax=Haloarcula rubra TaxID=2487747 RepID=A0AAW4PR55_9EURY|nr:hypothetical protein [Halomicroarcula rubra]MBX0323676.1 hypothetical protein [Halomicroarcula rubra]
MSADVAAGSQSTVTHVERLVRQTAVAVRGAFSRRDGRVTFAATSVSYLVVYLAGLRHLGLGPWGFEVSVVADPLARATRLVSPFQWEPVALVAAGPVELLVSPLNVALGAILATLVGVNLAVSVVAYRGPKACKIGPGAGAAAGLPGLLSGFACCGPTILLVVGLQASATVLTVFQWLVPFAGLALVGTLLWVGTKVDPDA